MVAQMTLDEKVRNYIYNSEEWNWKIIVESHLWNHQ
jgi:hypothetical protein